MIIKEYTKKLAVGSITKIELLEKMLVEFDEMNDITFILELVSKNQILQFTSIKEVLDFINKNRIINLFKLSIYNSNSNVISILSTCAENNLWTIEYLKCEQKLYNQINSTITKYFGKKSLGLVRRKLEIMIPLYITLVVSSILLIVLIFSFNKLNYPIGILFGYAFLVYAYTQFYERYISKLSKSSIYLSSNKKSNDEKKENRIKSLWKSLGIVTKIQIISTVFTIISIILTILVLLKF
ncbi:hypothetical protein RJI07_00620 [Mycoplasmatota bacterium WC30]